MTISKDQLLVWLRNTAGVLAENKAYLTELDSAIGDADHGTNIARGFAAVVEKLQPSAGEDIGALLKTTAMTLMSTVGGASGMLYGNFFLKAAAMAQGKESLTEQELVDLLETGVNGVVQRGRAKVGDKTMVDTWQPALETLRLQVADGTDLVTALTASVDAAKKGMKSTIPLQARKGRASYLGERSIGHQDPGATSSYMILEALLDAVRDTSKGNE